MARDLVSSLLVSSFQAPPRGPGVRAVRVISSDIAIDVGGCHQRSYVQRDGIHAAQEADTRDATTDRKIARKKLETVPTPFTAGIVSRYLDWPVFRANRWIQHFLIKGDLVKAIGCPGFVWRDVA